MAKIKIDKDKCKGCYLCIVNCPNNLIKASDKLNIKGVKYAVFSGNKPVLRSHARKLHGEGGCTGCGMCALICPECIIEITK